MNTGAYYWSQVEYILELKIDWRESLNWGDKRGLPRSSLGLQIEENHDGAWQKVLLIGSSWSLLKLEITGKEPFSMWQEVSTIVVVAWRESCSDKRCFPLKPIGFHGSLRLNRESNPSSTRGAKSTYWVSRLTVKRPTQRLLDVALKKIGPGGLRAPPEVVFAMHSWPLLLPTFSQLLQETLCLMVNNDAICYISPAIAQL